MRLAATCLTMLASLALATPTGARTRPAPEARPAAPPHAWLFGTWTGGLFPVLDGMAAQDCRTQPTVSFAKDAVSHATLTGSTALVQNIETVRATASGAEFRFQHAGNHAGDHAGDSGGGFGCENPDELHVARSGANEISFPRCGAFPYPLQRCGGM